MTDVQISAEITTIFKSDEVRKMHEDRLGRDPLVMMRELQGDIDASGALANADKWLQIGEGKDRRVTSGTVQPGSCRTLFGPTTSG